MDFPHLSSQIPVLCARHEKSTGKQEREKAMILLHMRTLPSPIPNTLYYSSLQKCSALRIWIVCAGVDACSVNEYSVAAHAHPTPNELLMACYHYSTLK
jgi:hypothetical protein